MEEKKNNKGLVWLIVILIILVLGLVGYVVYNKVLSKDAEKINNNEKDNTTTTITTTDNIESNINDDKNNKIKDIILDFESEQENNRLEVGHGLPSQYTEDKYTINMTIDNINVNGKRNNVKIKNYEPNDYNCEEGKDKVVLFNDNIIYEPLGEACYLTSLGEIIVFNKNYIVLRFFAEGGGWFNIYDAEGNELKAEEDISVAEIKSVENEVIKFISYEYNENGDLCRPNEYEMTIENNTIKHRLVKTGEFVGCM